MASSTKPERDLLDAAERARSEAERARRLADDQTQAEVIADLRMYAQDLDRHAFPFEHQAEEFRQRLVTTQRLTEEVKELSETARQLMDKSSNG